MTYGRALLALALLLALLYLWDSSAARVVRKTTVAPDAGWIQYDEVRYEAQWGDRVTHIGMVRLFGRAKYRSAPFFTHHTMLTTGDYADPDVVSMHHTGGGNFIWTADKQPEGSALALHLVPLDRGVLLQLEQIDDGDTVGFIGREELDGRISGSDGSYLRLTHANHKYLLVERVDAAGG